ncbi:hypothetical protein BKI52_27200 [marine bacterium AO1-C]|nr:hypothetical protein BKI52_27200 [marine bacterium AO1-C]
MFKLKLITPQESLNHSKHKLSAEHTSGSQNSQSLDTITCKGKYQWSQAFKNPMGGYGMYHRLHFLSLTDEYFGFVQTYEHERGGHVDQFLHVLDFQGNLHWSFAGSDLDLHQGVVYTDKLWLFHSDIRKLEAVPSPSFYSKILVQFDIASGQQDFHRAITQLKHLERLNPDLQDWLEVYGNPAKIELLEKRGEILIQLMARSQKGNTPQKIKMAFGEFLAYVQ